MGSCPETERQSQEPGSGSVSVHWPWYTLALAALLSPHTHCVASRSATSDTSEQPAQPVKKGPSIMEVSAAQTSIADVPTHTVEPTPAAVLSYFASRLSAPGGLGPRVADAALVARTVAGETTHSATSSGKTEARVALEVLETFRGPPNKRWELTWPVTGAGGEPHPGLRPKVAGLLCAPSPAADVLVWDGARSFWPDPANTLGAATRWVVEGADPLALSERASSGGALLIVVEALVRQRRLDTLSAWTRTATHPRAGLILRAGSWRAGDHDTALAGFELGSLGESDWSALGCHVVRAGELVLALQCVAPERPIDPAALDTGAP